MMLSTVLLAGGVLAGCGDSGEKTGNGQEAAQTAAPAVQGADLSAEVAAYREFVLEQQDQFLLETQKFVDAVKAGDMEQAKAIYPQARMYFERSEPVAEVFGELDPKIDGRLADLEEEGKGKEEWSGYHKLEYGLWVEQTTSGYEPVADQLLAHVKELRAKVETVDVTAELMINGAVDLLNEVSTSKITGEEEIYSHTDLYDFKANIEGAEKIFTIFQPKLESKDAKLTASLQASFQKVNELLAKYEDGKGGYLSYEALTPANTKELSEAVDQLGEPLSQMAIVVE